MYLDHFRPQKVYVRYERVGPATTSGSVGVESPSPSTMSSGQKVLSFPLESDLQEVEIPSLEAGRYVVCAEAVRVADGAVLEEQCFVTIVGGEGGGGLSGRATVTGRGKDESKLGFSHTIKSK